MCFFLIIVTQEIDWVGRFCQKTVLKYFFLICCLIYFIFFYVCCGGPLLCPNVVWRSVYFNCFSLFSKIILSFPFPFLC